MEVCRLCNTSKPQRDLTTLDDNTKEIPKKLQETFNIELILTQNPSHNFCCRTCVKKLDASHAFYQQVVENQKKFEPFSYDPLFAVVNIKSEVNEVADEDYGDYDEAYEDEDDDGDEDWCGGGTTSRKKNETKSPSGGQKLSITPKDEDTSYNNPKKRKLDSTEEQSTDNMKILKFTAKEIDDCTIIEDGNIKFLPKRHFNTEGKTPYITYLSEKLRSASSTHSSFRVCDGFKPSGKRNKICYVLCDHKKKMPVSFVAFEHQFGSPLTMRWKVDCEHCAGTAKDVKENLEPRQVINYEPTESDNVEFKNAMKILAGSLNTALLGIEKKCLSDTNPMHALYTNVAEFGIIVNSAVVETIFALRKTMTGI